MQFWIDGKSYNPQETDVLEKVFREVDYLQPVIAFTRFWFSTETTWFAKTSGSTSEPKNISIERRKIEISARQSLDYFQLKSPETGLVLCLSANHVGGFMVLARAFVGDLDVWILPPSSNPMGADGLPAFRKWFISMVPLQFYTMLSRQSSVVQSFGWKGILLGGADLSETETVRMKLLGCPVFHSYGMTETVSHIAVRQIFPTLNSTLNTIPFEVFPGVKIRTNPDSCLEINAQVTDNKWITTMDHVEIFSSTQFLFLGRADFMINSGGVKIDPVQVKQLLTSILTSYTLSFEILGLPDSRFGEKVVVVFFEADENVFKEFWNTVFWEMSLAKIKDENQRRFLPSSVFYLPEKPLTASQKVDYPRLRKIISDQNPVWDKWKDHQT